MLSRKALGLSIVIVMLISAACGSTPAAPATLAAPVESTTPLPTLTITNTATPAPNVCDPTNPILWNPQYPVECGDQGETTYQLADGSSITVSNMRIEWVGEQNDLAFFIYLTMEHTIGGGSMQQVEPAACLLNSRYWMSENGQQVEYESLTMTIACGVYPVNGDFQPYFDGTIPIQFPQSDTANILTFGPPTGTPTITFTPAPTNTPTVTITYTWVPTSTP